MKEIKIFNEEGLVLSFAKQGDSGIDVYANELSIVVEGIQGIKEYKNEFLMVSKEYCREHQFDSNVIEKKFCLEFNRMLQNLKHEDVIVVKMFFKYMTGTRTILPANTDIKGKPKSSKSKNAPYLDSLQNCDGVIDEGYRGIIQYNYEFNSQVTYLLMINLQNHPESIPYLVELIAKKVYLPSTTKAIGQMVPENREDFKLISVPEWKPEYEITDRGTGGHGSTNR